jgi:hypothetical protein
VILKSSSFEKISLNLGRLVSNMQEADNLWDTLSDKESPIKERFQNLVLGKLREKAEGSVGDIEEDKSLSGYNPPKTHKFKNAFKLKALKFSKTAADVDDILNITKAIGIGREEYGMVRGKLKDKTKHGVVEFFNARPDDEEYIPPMPIKRSKGINKLSQVNIPVKKLTKYKYPSTGSDIEHFTPPAHEWEDESYATP